MPKLYLPNLPDPIALAVAPLFDALPPDRAMTRLVVDAVDGELVSAVETIVRDPAIGPRSALAAGLWLYIDELDRSHAISQQLPGATGSFWHGIMHRREGDFSNSHYWFRRVGDHPAMPAIGDDYDPYKLIDEVQSAHRANHADERLINLQRREWIALFQWCATNGQ